MKKSFKVLLAVMCVAIMSIAFAGCNLGYPKVAGCTYKYDKVEYNTEGLSANFVLGLTAQVATLEAGAPNEMTFSAEDDTVEFKSIIGTAKTYTYEQSGANVVVYDAPNKNTNYDGTRVTGFTITKESNEVLTWHIMLTSGGEEVDIYMYYNLVPETPAE